MSVHRVMNYRYKDVEREKEEENVHVMSNNTNTQKLFDPTISSVLT